ncbi:ACP phosphodiesterase (plasmid) [Vibrio sp. qd031]|uniref:acyl carrier protein phosphodiesterase n=1 Tax=Vibrio sp. qd031 TaxID=1603038 RepID=UPI000A0F4865|nr:ACP phosphodiesterase [Vibrio sp. qd031]ORT52492.1 ACP phosphodiesterase [Vibrio sp. qd031]
MNFLAHLHIADHCDSDLSGNLLGDFVKGNPNGKFPLAVVQGIKMHRFVDKYTDTHQVALTQKRLFVKQHQRFAPIALDLFWDHCLSKHWSQFHNQGIDVFCHSCARETQTKMLDLSTPERYQRVISAMWEGNWLLSYKKFDNIGRALHRMSLRSPRMGPLADCFIDLNEHYETFEDAFFELYPQVLDATKLHANTIAKEIIQ